MLGEGVHPARTRMRGSCHRGTEPAAASGSHHLPPDRSAQCGLDQVFEIDDHLTRQNERREATNCSGDEQDALNVTTAYRVRLLEQQDKAKDQPTIEPGLDEPRSQPDGEAPLPILIRLGRGDEIERNEADG